MLASRSRNEAFRTMTRIKLKSGATLQKEPETISIRLQAVRLYSRLSQGEMGQRLGISKSAYKNYELGKRQIPLPVVLRLIQQYDLDADWFLFGDQFPKSRDRKDVKQDQFANPSPQRTVLPR